MYTKQRPWVSAFFLWRYFEQTSVIHHFTTVDSTNSLAVRMAEQGAVHGTVIHADQQTGGRGRGGRQFYSPSGGLYFSVIMKTQLENQDLPLVPLAAGVGLCRAIQTITGAEVWLKWPNDLYFHDRKVAGILTESGPFFPGSGPEYLVVGVGLNLTTKCSLFPSDLRSRVISLYHHTRHLDRKKFLQASVDAILDAVRRLVPDRNGLLDNWRSLDYLQGRNLEFAGPDGVMTATGIGLADDGRYCIRERSGVEHSIVVGDLTPFQLTEFSAPNPGRRL